MKKSNTHIQTLSVPFKYPVVFTHDVFSETNHAIEEILRGIPDTGPHRIIAYIDDGVIAAVPGIAGRIQRRLRKSGIFNLVRPPETVPGGERTKNGWNVVQGIISTIGSAKLCRHSFVMAVGGGSVLDMVGFAASLVHRGIRLIRVPTTVLAQNDAGVGVKTGMDEHGMKNFVGTFSPPFAVLVDFNFLETVPDRYWFGGLAESFKVALIKDASLFAFLERNAPRFAARELSAMETAVRRTARLHLDHIRTAGDPFELGAARPLDFGHWAAHKLEILSNYHLSHGEAVAVGIALDVCYACRTRLITSVERGRILKAMTASGMTVWHRILERRSANGSLQVLDGLEDFREHLGGRLTITLPRHIGRRVEIHRMDTTAIRNAVADLRRLGRTLPQ